jgi:hypothetical protein
MDKINKKLFLFSIAIVLFLGSASAHAHSVDPLIINEKVVKRDIVEGKITLTNDKSHKLDLHRFIENIRKGENEERYPTLLGEWLRISPSFELQPYETREVSYEIKVSPRAEPGMYHATITFAKGFTRDEAKKFIATSPKVTFNVEVVDTAQAVIQLVKFVPDKRVFLNYPVSFTYVLENTGDLSLTPVGELLIYDKRGKLISSLEANEGRVAFEPKSSEQLASIWNPDIKLGRYKAILRLDYGKDHNSIQDTVFFWIIPWPFMLLLLSGVIILVALTYYYFHKKRESEYYE